MLLYKKILLLIDTQKNPAQIMHEDGEENKNATKSN
jgi:hypothetical protein